MVILEFVLVEEFVWDFVGGFRDVVDVVLWFVSRCVWLSGSSVFYFGCLFVRVNCLGFVVFS